MALTGQYAGVRIIARLIPSTLLARWIMSVSPGCVLSTHPIFPTARENKLPRFYQTSTQKSNICLLIHMLKSQLLETLT